MRKLFSIVAALSLLAVAARALSPKLQEDFGVQQYFEGVTSATQTYAASGLGVGWSVSSIGGTTTFTISHSTGVGFSINTSSTITVLSGEYVKGMFRGIVVNPQINMLTITATGTTAYVDISYLAPRNAGSSY